MSTYCRTLPQHIFRGVLHGVAAWAAYAVLEFLCSSVLYRLTRPYAMFTAWHWKLTGFLVIGFLIAGVLAGLGAGLGVFFVEGRGRSGGTRPAAIAPAVTLLLVLAFAGHILANPRSATGWYWLLATAFVFIALLLAAIRSPQWQQRLRVLTNPWLVSALLLGMGQEGVLLEMGLAEQLGIHVRFWAAALGIALLVLAAGALIIGRSIPFGRNWPAKLLDSHNAPLSVALVLLVISELLAGAKPALPSPVATAKPEQARPNVLLIVMDTVRADHLSTYGYDRETTPNLKKLAPDTVNYMQTMSASDLTLTSHASLFTGMYPSWHGAYCQPPEAAHGARMSEAFPTIGEILAGHGYTTMGVAANLYLRSEFGLARGFQTFRIPRPVPVLNSENWYFLRRPMRRLLSYAVNTSEFDRLFARSEDIAGEVLSTLERRTAGAPFFAFVNYMDAHYPYVPPAPFDVRFPGKVPQMTAEELGTEQDQISLGEPIPAGFQAHSWSQYDGGIAYMDAQIGSLVDWLKQSGLYDDTMIIVTSDHGEAFGEKNHVGHANSPYQVLLHVPLLIKYPHAKRRGVWEQPVSLIDVAPTILDTIGLAAPASMQGRSLDRPASSESRELFGETFPCPVLQSPECPRGCTARAVFSWPYKFITSTNGKRALFDLRNDTSENNSVIEALPALARQLNSDLHAWLQTAPARRRQNLQLDPQSLQHLKSLGYAQ